VSKKVIWYDLTLMDEQRSTLDQSETEVTRGASGSEGASTTTIADLFGSKTEPGGGTSLSKREVFVLAHRCLNIGPCVMGMLMDT
jgi:hypothetical protein